MRQRVADAQTVVATMTAALPEGAPAAAGEAAAQLQQLAAQSRQLAGQARTLAAQRRQISAELKQLAAERKQLAGQRTQLTHRAKELAAQRRQLKDRSRQIVDPAYRPAAVPTAAAAAARNALRAKAVAGANVLANNLPTPPANETLPGLLQSVRRAARLRAVDWQRPMARAQHPTNQPADEIAMQVANAAALINALFSQLGGLELQQRSLVAQSALLDAQGSGDGIPSRPPSTAQVRT